MNQLLLDEKPVSTMHGSFALRLAGKTPFTAPIVRRLLEISDEGRVSITQTILNRISPGLATAATRARNLAVQLFLDRHNTATEADELVQILVELNQTLDELACHHMGPKTEMSDLLPALTELARVTTCHHRIRCHFQQIGLAPQLPLDQIPHLYRLANDSVAMAHQRGATTILIRLETLPGLLCLNVIDNSEISKKQTQVALEVLSFRGTLIGVRVGMSILPDGRCNTHCQLIQK